MSSQECSQHDSHMKFCVPSIGATPNQLTYSTYGCHRIEADSRGNAVR